MAKLAKRFSYSLPSVSNVGKFKNENFGHPVTSLTQDEALKNSHSEDRSIISSEDENSLSSVVSKCKFSPMYRTPVKVSSFFNSY